MDGGSSLIPLSRGSFDVIVGMDWLSKRNFVIVCYEKVVRIPLEGDEIFRVHGEHTLGAAKALMNAKVDEPKISDIPVARDITDVFPEDFSMTTTTTNFWSSYHQLQVHEDAIPKTAFRTRFVIVFIDDILAYSKSKDVNIEVHGSLCWVTKGRRSLVDALSRKERVKPRRVRAMAMTIQYGVRGMILAAQSEAFKQENHPQADGQSESMVQTLEDIMRECVIDFGGSYHLRIWCAPFEALYGRKCRSPVIWADIEGSSLIGPELVQETTDKEVLIKEKLKAARDHQRSYADNRLKPLEFEVGDRPFEILERIGPVAYRLRLPEELSGVHDTFHVSNLKKCLADASLHVPLDEIKVDKTLRFVEESVEIMDREVKRLKCSRMVVVRVYLGSKRGL
ncbi:putative reverse transcriptase domain-containing protein [Tanacetum coccineum]